MAESGRIEPIILQTVIEILSAKLGTQVQIQSTEILSKDWRRNLIARIKLTDSQTFILKQSKIDDKSGKNDSDALARFARDWAGLEFLSDAQETIVPKFYGGSIKHRFILTQDLGNHISLVDHLMGSDKDLAIDALARYVKLMAKFHGFSHKDIGNYKSSLTKIHPDINMWQDGFKDMPAQIKKLLEKMNIECSQDFETEMHNIFKMVKEPNPFTVLMHGDICPDNIFDSPTHQMKLIDFEWSYLGNALLDAVYLRMYMPTCWCVMSFPDIVVESCEKIYREELIKYIPDAADDKLYYEYYVAACAYTIFWRIMSIDYVLEKEMSGSDLEFTNHPLWRDEYNIQRPRQLMRLKAFIDIAQKHNQLPHTKLMAEKLLECLNLRWTDDKPMELYPVFR